ncbi:MAG: hypothetical protein R3D31_01320 [Hyphomicrobiaceae bacterium]
MSLALKLALLSVVAAVVMLFVIGKIAANVEKTNPTEQGRRIAGLLRMVAYVDLIIIPIVVYVAVQAAGL